MTELRATYRLMLGADFGFADARALVPYLRDLGVSHVYLPPSFAARAGSTHGYDIIDPGRISDELGGEGEFRALCAAAREAGLGVVLDVVPNHMAADAANRYWTDERAKYFDVDPQHPEVYRRFFDVDHLAGVRQEDAEVFEETHRLVLGLVADATVEGLRIDHPDGLADPKGYLDRLRERGVPHVWVEKILDPGERLRRDWPVDGTVGYEFLVDATALFVDPAAEPPLTALWEDVSGDVRPFGEWAVEAKREQVRGPLARDVQRLRREWSDMPRGIDLVDALCALPVYRTYLRDGAASEEDRAVLRGAGIEWLLDAPAPFVTRFQQTTPAVMAKGVEDTAFYRYARLVALNEVGGDPSRFGIDVARFHEANLARPERNLLITSTHDTKRSGDTRARSGAIAAIPDEWREWVLPQLHEDFRLEAYFIAQNLAAVGPIAAERIDRFVEKALREMKRASNWLDPDLDHEAAVKEWARRLDTSPIAPRLAAIGDRHALAQVLLKLTVTGLPDIYNGHEVCGLSLVDPDNRRPIDWARVRRGDAKTQLIRTALRARAAGAYEPLDADDGVCAFARGGRVFVAVAVRDGARLPALPGERIWAAHGMALHVRA